MTTVMVDAGACGFSTTITVEKSKDGKMTLALETRCEMVQKMLEDIAILDRFATLSGFQNNPVYLSAARHLKHVACPVPSGILKALEVEAGLNVAKDVSTVFSKKK
ncbi:MAG: hypothetical protein A2078_10140 [Nitrospirae bacterium GWC2_57_9]|nr:MAG: hypothetical protein A2078_10140 [Nitrospirae bacterium GWC2_57_9]